MTTVNVHIHGLTADNWEEGKHPRAPDGKFGSGGSGGGAGKVGDPKFHEANYAAASAKNKAAFEALKGKKLHHNDPGLIAQKNLALAAESHAAAARSAHRGNIKAAAQHHEQALKHEAMAAQSK